MSKIVKLSQIEENKTPPEAIIEGLVRRGEVMNLVGPLRCGLTSMAHQMALCVATGVPFLGMDVRFGNALIIDNQIKPEALYSRVRLLADQDPFKQFPQLAHRISVMTCRDDCNMESVGETLREAENLPACDRFDLVIVDAAYKLIDPECDNSSVFAAYSAISLWAENLNAAVVLLHHSRKPTKGVGRAETSAGCGANLRAADTSVELLERDSSGTFEFGAATRSFETMKSFLVKMEFQKWVRVGAEQ